MDRIKAIIFDLYGTLIYLENETKPYLKLLKELRKYKSIKQLKNIFLTRDFISFSDLINQIAPNIQIDLNYLELDILKEIESAKLFPETLEVIEKLRSNNISIGVISNLATPYKKPFFNFGLEKIVDKYIFSCDIGIKKPDENIYKLMIDDLKIPPKEILMVGDSIYCDYNGPKTVKMNVLLLDRENKHNFSDKISSLNDIFKKERFFRR